MKKKELKRLLLAAQEALAAKTPPSPTLAEWAPVYDEIISQRKYTAQTVMNKRCNVKHLIAFWGAQRLNEIRPHAVSVALREFGAQHSSTAQRVLSELRDFFDEAIANGVAGNNPARHVKMPTSRVQRKRLSLEAWQGAYGHALQLGQPWVPALLRLALVTGQRRGDLLKMRFDDIRAGALYVEQQKKAGKEFGARLAIPLQLRLEAIGVSLQDVVEQCSAAGSPGPTLLRKANGSPLESSSASIRFSECIRAALGEDAYTGWQWPSLHEVRSLSARLYKAQGIDVQTLLGHKNPDMTAVYTDDRGLSAHIYKRVLCEGEPCETPQNARPGQPSRIRVRANGCRQDAGAHSGGISAVLGGAHRAQRVVVLR